MKYQFDLLLSTYRFEISENDQTRYGFQYFLPILDAVRNGDEEALHKFHFQEIGSHIGKLAKKQEKQAEYFCCIAAYLLKQPMLDAGLDYKLVSDLCDVFLQQLAFTKTISEQETLLYEYLTYITKCTHSWRKRHISRSVVDQAKEYILQNNTKKLSVAELARALSVHPAYLSRIFRKKEHMTIQQYLRIERINAASVMLQYSSESISVISEYFCFSSQSHFTKIFKDLMGVTPGTYRKMHSRD